MALFQSPSNRYKLSYIFQAAAEHKYKVCVVGAGFGGLGIAKTLDEMEIE